MAAHKNLFKKCLDFAKANGLTHEVSHATGTTSSYLTIYLLDTNGEINGEMSCRFSDHKTPNEGFHSFDSFLSGNKFSAISEKLNTAAQLNGQIDPDAEFVEL